MENCRECNYPIKIYFIIDILNSTILLAYRIDLLVIL